VNRTIFVLLALLGFAPPLHPAMAQGQMHPRWEIPGFEFSRNGVWRARTRRVVQTRRALLSQRAFGRLNAALLAPNLRAGLSAPAVTGVLKVPAILLQFADVAGPYPPAMYDAVLFGTTPPAGRPYTIRTFYEQLSHGLFSMQGQVLGWVALSKPEVSYTGGTNCSGNPYGTSNCNGIFDSPTMNPVDSMQAGLREALTLLDVAGTDWGQFDNDGPDGIPNSGDDDGYVDMAIFIHPTVDGACGGNNNFWSHRFVLVNQSSTAESAFVTTTPSASGGFIKVRDYTMQSGLGGSGACTASQIMPIGTAGHESGHGLDLPDLYDTQYLTQGSGQWGLMGSGNYTSPFSPSRMEAWSLSELGWVTVAPLTQSGTYTLGPAPTAESTYVVRVQGSNPRGEYFLLENREAVLADTALIRLHCAKSGNSPNCGGGLLVWHVDSTQVANNGFHVSNRVNSGPIHGVELEQADGLRNLEYPDGNPQSTRGDAGDPYPGVTANTTFSFKTNPAAIKNSDGSFVGFAIDSIQRAGTNGVVSFRLRFGGITQVQASDTTALVQLDGTNYHVFQDVLDSTMPHLVSVADTQYRVDSLVRWKFQSWSDGLSRIHPFTPSLSGGTLVATLSRAFRLQVATSGGGTVTTTPPAVAGSYVAEGGPIQLVAHPNSGLIFLGWSGDTLSGDSVLSVAMQHPRALTATFGAQLAIHDVLQQLVTGASSLSSAQVRYVDLLGNKNDVTHVDVGDFLAWVRTAHPTPPGAPKQEGGP
jgi:M6 family metalloprotease-like protein